MEAVISVCLGIWIMLSGVICFVYMKNDEKREEKK